MNIKIIKLITGEEFIAEVTNAVGPVIVKNARRFIMTNQGVSLIPLSLFTDEKEELSIPQIHVVFMANPNDEVTNGYRQEIGGVVVPNKKLIV